MKKLITEEHVEENVLGIVERENEKECGIGGIMRQITP